jgi:hypothetical protein
VLIAARAENASTNIVSPAHEAAELTDALSSSVGAPASRPTESSQALADELRKSVAKLDQKIDKFAASNDKMEGKKVEGTGLIQVPYLAWLGGAIILVLVFWHLAKTALTLASGANPGALVGVAGMNVVGSVVSKGFQQVVKGGEKFKEWIDKEIEDPALKQKVLDAFAVAHKKAQDEDVKTLVDKVIK